MGFGLDTVFRVLVSIFFIGSFLVEEQQVMLSVNIIISKYFMNCCFLIGRL
jgi:hypothetical protein